MSHIKNTNVTQQQAEDGVLDGDQYTLSPLRAKQAIAKQVPELSAVSDSSKATTSATTAPATGGFPLDAKIYDYFFLDNNDASNMDGEKGSGASFGGGSSGTFNQVDPWGGAQAHKRTQPATLSMAGASIADEALRSWGGWTRMPTIPAADEILFELSLNGVIFRVVRLSSGNIGIKRTNTLEWQAAYDGSWEHWSYTWDASDPSAEKLKMYRNGVKVYTYNVGGTLVGGFGLGSQATVEERYYSSFFISDFRLSDAEILAYANATQPDGVKGASYEWEANASAISTLQTDKVSAGYTARSLVTQNLSANTLTAIAFEDEVDADADLSANVGGTEFTFNKAKLALINYHAEIKRIDTGGITDVVVFLQKSTDGGTTWAQVDDSWSDVGLANNGQRSISHSVLHSFNAGDKFRLVYWTETSTFIQVQHITTPAALLVHDATAESESAGLVVTYLRG